MDEVEDDLEESITSSPQQTSSSIHRIRQHRKSKRRRLHAAAVEETAIQFTLDKSCATGEIITSENEAPETVESSQYLVIDPFKDLELLLAADRVYCEQPPHEGNNAQRLVSSGFQTFEDIAASQELLDEPYPFPYGSSPPLKQMTFPITQRETQIEFTDEELVQSCKIAEQVLAEAEEVAVKTPQIVKTKSVVDMILEDFLSSPLSPNYNGTEAHCQPDDCKPTFSGAAQKPLTTTAGLKSRQVLDETAASSANSKSVVQMILDDFCSSPLSCENDDSIEAGDCTPTFNFNGGNLRTYSRRRLSSARQNIEERLRIAGDKSPISDVDPTDDPSELLNKSQSLCGNLLNLSCFFNPDDEDEVEACNIVNKGIAIEQGTKESSVQRSSEVYLTALEEVKQEPASTSDFSENSPAHSQIIEEIHTLRQKYPDSFSGRSSPLSGDFFGFPPISRLKASNRRISKESIKPQCELPVESAQIVIKNEDVFGSSDDDEFFANFNTQEAFSLKTETTGIASRTSKTVAASDIKHVGFSYSSKVNLGDQAVIGTEPFQTASIKKITISKEAKKRAQAILADLPPLDYEVDQEKLAVKQVLRNLYKAEETPSGSKNAVLKVGFQTASMKKITISEEAKKRAQSILDDLPPLDYNDDQDKSTVKPGISSLGKADGTPSGSKNAVVRVGFQTASMKKITVSKEAEKRAKIILDELPPLNYEDNQEKSTFRSVVSSLGRADDTPSGSKNSVVNVGFQTASMKKITVSKEAEKRAQAILDDLPALNYADDAEVSNVKSADDIPSGSKAAIVKIGFQTASMNKITISEEAEKRAQAILENLPPLDYEDDTLSKQSSEGKEIEIKTEVIDSDIDFQNMVLSEWILEEEQSLKPNAQKFPNIYTNEEYNLCKKIKLEDYTPVVAAAREIVKRKLHSESDSDDSNGSTLSTKKKICQSGTADFELRTPLNHIENNAMAVQTPQNLVATPSVISRKNLLSLSKKRKKSKVVKSSQDVLKTTAESTTTINTPIRRKTMPPTATYTPNQKEFFDPSICTSTPNARTFKNKPTEIVMGFAGFAQSATIEKNNNCNNSLNAAASTSNIDTTCDKANNDAKQPPTPEQRIERLSMYDNPPANSPIITSSSNICRSVGLRRVSSRIKLSKS